MLRGIIWITPAEIELVKGLCVGEDGSIVCDIGNRLASFVPPQPPEPQYKVEIHIEDAEYLLDKLATNGDAPPEDEIKHGLRDKLTKFYSEKKKEESDDLQQAEAA